MAFLTSGLLGASTFFAREHRSDDCDAKGLPLTPNSIVMTGRFQRLKSISHKNLCAYLDLVKGNDERLVFVSEYYTDSLENNLQSKKFNSSSALAGVTCQVLEGLSFLHDRNIVHRNLSPDNILITSEGQLKLFNYGLYEISDCGKAVSFPISSPRYLAPEVLLSGAGKGSNSNPKSDLWSLGIIILELLMESHIYPSLFLKNGLGTLFMRIFCLVQNYKRNGTVPLDALLDTHSFPASKLDSQLRAFLEAVLTPFPSDRPCAQELLTHRFVFPTLVKEQTNVQKQKGITLRLESPFHSLYRCKDLGLHFHSPTHTSSSSSSSPQEDDDYMKELTAQEIYFLWTLAGGDLWVELQKNGLTKTTPPISNLPCLVSSDGSEFGLTKDGVGLYNPAVVVLPMEQLRKRLEKMTAEDFYPILADPKKTGSKRVSRVTINPEQAESSKLPLLIKERDVEYQFHRMIHFRRLLDGYPFSREQIITEAITDVCPLLRGEIWAALLNVRGDIQSVYANIDKDTAIPTDRQIAVDIPRCHQYDLLLASPEGHRKFMRVLKAWVVSHPKLVYWQGLDSLCAPLLALNFNNEALAYACLNAFIDKYLSNFFCRDNSSVMQEYLAIFGQMVAFHDPELFNHLDSSGFNPELYAIPWFLTTFTHIFPLQKIYHLWDTLLLGNSSFPLFVGTAILMRLRNELLTFGFNECILLFSDMPDIEIQQCITDALCLYQATPPSLCLRSQQSDHAQHPDIPPEARKQPVPIEVLRLESSPQISAHDLITLCQLESQAFCYTNSLPPPRKDPQNPLLWKKLPDGSSGLGKKEALVIDVRSPEEYRQGHFPRSINLPHEEAFNADGSLVSSSSHQLQQYWGKTIAIVSGRGDPGATFARQLVRLNFPRVCLLHGGTGVLRSLGMLSAI